MHDINTRDANSVPQAEIWEFSQLDIIDAVIITNIFAFGIMFYVDY